MAYYDNFLKRSKISKFGVFIVKRQNDFFIKKILKYSNNSHGKIRVLEIGPGKGYFAEECRKHDFEYQCIEPNVNMYESLKKRNFKVHCFQVPPIRVKDEFDVIFMNQVFEHMSCRAEALKLFEDCKKRLNTGGLLIISVPDITYSKEDFWGSDYTHSFPLSLYSLKQIYTDFDFDIKYANVKTIFFEGYFITKLIKFITSVFYNLGILKLIFGKKSYKIKNLSNASCVVVGIKHE